MLDLCLLGCGGSMPTYHRYLTSMLVSVEGRKILIDCGEGTQVSMKVLGWGFKTIDIICFTHYHADHVMGITGLLLTIANSGRTEPMTLIGPPGLKTVIMGLTVVAPVLPYDLNLIEIPIIPKEESKCMDIPIKTPGLENISIKCISVEHSMPCLSYSIYIKRRPKFSIDKAKENNVPVSLWNVLQKGESVTEHGVIYVPNMVLGEERRGIKISYCTDTRPITELVSFVKDSDLFICEGMYGEDNEILKALKNKHMLFSEAAAIARKGNVKELWLTHFSPSFNNPEFYLPDTKKIFENTFIGEDRKVKNFKFQ